MRQDTPMTTDILPAAPGDAGALSDIGRRTFTRKFGHLYSADNLQKFLDEDHSVLAYQSMLENEDYGVWKAVETDTGELAGYAVAARFCRLPVDKPDAEVRAAEIKRLYVLDHYQGSGLGRRMLQVILDWIETDGPRPVYLSVYKYNDGAQRFYHRFGFSFHKEYEYMVGDHADPEYIFMRPSPDAS